MRKSHINLSFFFQFIAIVSSMTAAIAVASPTPQPEKEWTLLVFLNGNNNLDRFGHLNMNQMEQVGSTSDLNVVVQWASLANKKTQRVYVTKDNDPKKVTSPVLQDMGNVDMGDWKNLVEFVKWGVANFPAKHYFIDVWDHGSGWHALTALGNSSPNMFHPMDISWDDHTGHAITTAQLGQALAESAQIIGHKVDLYASDACLMGMFEIANEVADSVSIYGGSEEVEAGEGWPYHTFLTRWTKNPTATASEVGTYLTEEFVASYNGGTNGRQDATFSIFDLSQMPQVLTAITDFGKHLMKVDATAKAKVVKAITQTQNFTYSDYGDMIDFINQLDAAKIEGIDKQVLDSTKQVVQDFIVTRATTPNYERAYGAAIWLPYTASTLNTHLEKYKKLKFNQATNWADTLQYLHK